MLPTQWQCPTRGHGAAADRGKTQENKTIEISSPNKTDRRKPRRSDRPIYMEINSALTSVHVRATQRSLSTRYRDSVLPSVILSTTGR
jgi:hypothetical protein